MAKESVTLGSLLVKNYKWFLFVFILGISHHAQSQEYNFREFTDGLAQPYVYSIIQDNKGYLWIGTGNGLSRYDGSNFKSFTTKDSLADNFITCSFKNGSDIWYGHMNGNVSHYNGKVFRPVFASLQSSGISDIEKSPKGEIWAGTNSNGLMKLNEKGSVKRTPGANDQITIFSFQFLTENEILIGSADGLYHCRLNKSGKVDIIRHLSEIPDSKIQDIIKMRNGSGFYIATENEGIFQLVPVGKQFKVMKTGIGLYNNITGIQRIYEDRKSNLWISTFGSGLIKLSRSSSGRFDEATGFSKSTGFTTNNVKIAYEDREGNIWSGNYGAGLTQLTQKSFTLYSFDKDRYGAGIYSVFILNNYRWLGTDKGLLKTDRSTGKILKFYSSDYGLPKDKITAIYSDRFNELWMGTEKNGVFRMTIDKEKILRYKIGPGILENSITAITGKNEQIWIGTKKGACNIDPKSGHIRWYTMDKGELPHNYVNHLFIDSKGKLWISTLSNVLVFIKNGKVGKVMITSESGISSLGPIIEGNDSAIWVGSNGSGVFRIKSGSVINLTSKDNLFSDYCYSLMLDNNKNIWVGHRGGLSKIRAIDFFVKPIQQSAGINKSFEFNSNAVFKDDKNRICFGTNEGLLVYDPALENRELLPPVLNIISCKVNDEEVDYKDKLILSPGNYKFKIEFAGINMKEPSLIKYIYQLEGYDFSPVNTRTGSATYPRLTEGEYTFNLWAISGDGVMTKSPLTLHVIIKKPLWKQWWFDLSVFVILFLAVVFYIRRRDHRHLMEKRMLETKVQERTLEISKKNILLEEKKNEILAQNNELEIYKNYLEDIVDERTKELVIAKNRAEESDRLKTSFLNNISHEIRTPLNMISGFANLLGENDVTEEDKQVYINTINSNTDSLCFLLNEIVDMSMIEAGQFVFSNKKFKIDDVLKELENQYKSNNNKKIEFEFINRFRNNGLELYYDEARFRQIFINLINNAFKFTESGHIKFGYEVLQGSARFFVSDTGIGIDKSEIDKIFNPFYKVENNPHILYRGAGTGLTTFKKMVELMGGEIGVESVVHKGSVFYFMLPVTN